MIRSENINLNDTKDSTGRISKRRMGTMMGIEGPVLLTASDPPINVISKQINQIPTVLQQVLSLSFSSLLAANKEYKF